MCDTPAEEEFIIKWNGVWRILRVTTQQIITFPTRKEALTYLEKHEAAHQLNEMEK